MNHTFDKSLLKNKYFIMRHAESTANLKHLIISDPRISLFDYGLTENGKLSIEDAISQLKIVKPVIYSSDVLRAEETAEIVKEKLNIDTFFFDQRLRERYFGDFEGQDSEHYKEVWEDDKIHPENPEHHVESVESVYERMISFIHHVEDNHKNETILVVSHGDPLQILEAAFKGIEPKDHQKIEMIKNSEIRELN